MTYLQTKQVNSKQNLLNWKFCSCISLIFNLRNCISISIKSTLNVNSTAAFAYSSPCAISSSKSPNANNLKSKLTVSSQPKPQASNHPFNLNSKKSIWSCGTEKYKQTEKELHSVACSPNFAACFKAGEIRALLVSRAILCFLAIDIYKDKTKMLIEIRKKFSVKWR